ncbi:MAG: hypothetical protein [Microviridae sp.]|nr:MAG: hypothetical protein [Microviridae sp.]
MYTRQRPTTGTLIGVKSYNGETIEEKVRRMMNNKEPIKDTGPLNYTERKDGVRPEFNIRTDRMEVALEAMDTAAKSDLAKRQMSLGERAYEGMKAEDQAKFREKYPKSKQAKAFKDKEAGGQSAQGTQGA